MGNKSVPERKEGEATTISKADSKKKGISSSKLDSSRKSILIRSDSKRKVCDEDLLYLIELQYF